MDAKSDSERLENIKNRRYVLNITINHVEVQVTLDTGSTDLWVMPPSGLGTFNNTGIPINLCYGDGAYGTSGTIGVSPFNLGAYTVERQAFMRATTSTIGGLQEDGIYGVMGLGFDSIMISPINQKIRSLYGQNATWGRSVMRNIFAQDPNIPHFFGIDLSRTGDLEDTVGGTFTIGEHDQRFAGIADEPKLFQFPKGAYRWTTLFESISVDGMAIPLHSVNPGVPSGRAVAVLDTGEPNSVLPAHIFDAIYSRIPGSALYDNPSQRRAYGSFHATQQQA
ncbi:acid protease [Pholiota conissans]|uniref:Acid protease n=1 Tax=Pholiota conissans TaxID=109636 RepID=A0A9P6CUL2_9AGAR|nr:acid protease [Pholiota conissans]